MKLNYEKMASIKTEVEEFVVFQGTRSYDDDRVECAYRSKDGQLRCAIGYLIPDELYGPYLEGQSVDNFIEQDNPLGDHLLSLITDDYVEEPFNKLTPKEFGEVRQFYNNLQQFHDDYDHEDKKGFVLKSII